MRLLIASVLLLASPLLAQDSDGDAVSSPTGQVPDGLTPKDWTGIRAACRGRSPIFQQVYLKASNTDAGDEFGRSVAISGDTVVVGTLKEASIATGVNGDQSDDSAPRAGAAYVLVRSGTTWSQQAYLKASNTESWDAFGCSVAISGDTVVVGAFQEASSATGVNGDQSDNSAPYSGAAYVFVRCGTTWCQQAYLKASNTDRNDRFGFSVAVSGDTIVVGALWESSNATGVNGDQNNNNAWESGAAYVFVRTGTSWSQEAHLKASNTGRHDGFGYSVAVSGDTIVVGAKWEDSNATGVNGDQSNNNNTDSGAAYVFVRSGTEWSQEAYLKSWWTGPGQGERSGFGEAVATSNDTVVVGSETGYWGARVFGTDGTTWTRQARLMPPNIDSAVAFGRSVAISGDRILVGSIGDDSNATGVNGDPYNTLAPSSGAAFLFVREAWWRPEAYLKASNTEAGDRFGYSTGISGGTIVVGAFHEDSNATGVDGDQTNNDSEDSGAAYVFASCDAEQQASETVRLGWPPNPHAFLPGRTTGPIVGSTWDPVIDHETFATPAVVDFVGVDLIGPTNVPTVHGTLLITLPPSSQLFFTPPGVPFSISVPSDCSFVGIPAWSQGGSYSPGGVIEFANGLDLVLGTY